MQPFDLSSNLFLLITCLNVQKFWYPENWDLSFPDIGLCVQGTIVARYSMFLAAKSRSPGTKYEREHEIRMRRLIFEDKWCL
jgi:hypothetical protein